MHTDITVLYPETFDDATSLARRPTDGVGLDRAGGLGEMAMELGGGEPHWSAAASLTQHIQSEAAAARDGAGNARDSRGGGVETVKAKTPINVNDKRR